MNRGGPVLVTDREKRAVTVLEIAALQRTADFMRREASRLPDASEISHELGRWAEILLAAGYALEVGLQGDLDLEPPQ
jgi:hypothetical protein